MFISTKIGVALYHPKVTAGNACLAITNSPGDLLKNEVVSKRWLKISDKSPGKVL
jgi:hypothetical protein